MLAVSRILGVGYFLWAHGWLFYAQRQEALTIHSSRLNCNGLLGPRVWWV